jgi:hypothetical protein
VITSSRPTHPNCIYHSDLEAGHDNGERQHKGDTDAFAPFLTVIHALGHRDRGEQAEALRLENDGHGEILHDGVDS